MKRILIAEDNEKLRDELEIFLNNNGFKAGSLKDFENTLTEILNINPDLLLLDINLPNADGEYICKEIRKKSDMPIIIITSRDSEIDEFLSINNGADHYITKPFNIHILLAKINSLLKRAEKWSDSFEIINAGEFILNINKNTIEKDGKTIELTKNEFRILKYLTENKNKIVSREDIMLCLWDSDDFIGDSTLTVNMTRVRSKLELLGLKEMLETKRGQGYILKEKSKNEFQ